MHHSLHLTPASGPIFPFLNTVFFLSTHSFGLLHGQRKFSFFSCLPYYMAYIRTSKVMLFEQNQPPSYLEAFTSQITLWPFTFVQMALSFLYFWVSSVLNIVCTLCSKSSCWGDDQCTTIPSLPHPEKPVPISKSPTPWSCPRTLPKPLHLFPPKISFTLRTHPS